MPFHLGLVLFFYFTFHCTVKKTTIAGVPASDGASNHSHESPKKPQNRGLVGIGPYELFHNLPPNAVRPRIIISAHTHKFCDRTHSDGIREMTVPGMTCDARDDPGFVDATFKRNGRTVIVSKCSLAR